jgi:hypothetical protein
MMPQMLDCPFTGCSRTGFRRLSGLLRHTLKKHPNQPFTRQHAQRLDCDYCDLCNKPYQRGPSGSVPRHSNCPRQTQPSTPQAQREFAQAEASPGDEQIAAAVAEHLDPDGPHSQLYRRSAAERKAEILASLRACAGACDLDDGPRIESTLGRFLKAFSDRTEDRRDNSHTTKPTSDLSLDLQNAKRAVRILGHSGRVGKARRALEADELFEVTDDNIHLIRGRTDSNGAYDASGQIVPRLEDLEVPDDVWQNERFVAKLDATNVRAMLLSRDRTTGRGPSGTGYGDLQPLVDEPNFVEDLTKVLNAILTGKLPPSSPEARALRTARLVTLKKKNGKPRCIAVREVLMNLAYATLVRQSRDDIKKHLSEFDIGFGTPDCCAMAAHRTQLELNKAHRSGKSCLAIKIDIANAYGTTLRAAVLRLLVAKLPYLVRAFLVSYEHSSFLRLDGFDDIRVEEGLLQGDPAAPAFAQLLYADCCKRVRTAIPTLEILFSYFDDILSCDEPRRVVRALKKLIPILDSVGLKVQLEKSVAYTTGPLPPDVANWLSSVGITIAPDGFEYAGVPLGSTPFIRNYLRTKGDRVIHLISELSELHTLSKVDTTWADAQGLYALAHFSLNHLVRHLIRTVDPRHIRAEFPRVDEAITNFVGRLFEMAPNDFTPWRRKRLTLPYRHGGFGLITLTDPCEAAYLGCLYRHRRRLGEDPMEWVPGFKEAWQVVTGRLGQDALPGEAAFFGRGRTVTGPNDRDLAGELDEKTWKLLRQQMDAVATDSEKFVSLATSYSTCLDFLRAPISNRRYRIPSSAFVICGRAALVLPICRPQCFLCNDQPISTDGQHASGKHCRKRVVERHNALRDVIAAFLRLLRMQYNFTYNVSSEVPLTSIPEVTTTGKSLVCDFMLRNEVGNDMVFFDVRVVHPVMSNPAHGKKTVAAARLHWELKRKLYCDNTNLAPAAVQPMVFDTYGGMAPSTLAYLFKLVTRASRTNNQVDKDLRAKLWLDLRYRIATSLARTQARVIEYFNWRTRPSAGFSGGPGEASSSQGWRSSAQSQPGSAESSS